MPFSRAETRPTRVDGAEVVGALSPSRAVDFVTCPLRYRLRTVDRLPEEPTLGAARGTLVHKVLEDLFDLPAPQRTPDRAEEMVVPAWEHVLSGEPELAEMFTGEAGEERGRRAFRLRDVGVWEAGEAGMRGQGRERNGRSVFSTSDERPLKNPPLLRNLP